VITCPDPFAEIHRLDGDQETTGRWEELLEQAGEPVDQGSAGLSAHAALWLVADRGKMTRDFPHQNAK
jgi:hypothetical protein